MIIAINQRAYDGPWGGGNRFVKSLTEAIIAAGHQVVHDLRSAVDIILMIETRVRSPNVSFGAGGILRYLMRHPNTVVVHRINECDERKGGEKFITHRLLRANYAADVTVFVGSWLMDLPAWKTHGRATCDVILNGADTGIFNEAGGAVWDAHAPIKLVTHHWGNHPYKGFDTYRRIDELLGNPVFAAKFSMDYIGNLPRGFSFKNVRHVAPLDGAALATALKKNHVYVTASINEPGGNHQNEGALCGLPLVYRNSGCMPEYCDGFGVMFNGPDDIEAALGQMAANYEAYRAKMPAYPHTADQMAKNWLGYFESLMMRRDEIVKNRYLFRDPVAFLNNQIPL